MKEIYPSTQKIFEQDLSSLYDYSRIAEALEVMIDGYGTANQTYVEKGRGGLTDICMAESPETLEVLSDSKEVLSRGAGFLVLHNTSVDKLDDETAQLLSITLSSMYGRPTKTDRRLDQIAWPIKYDPDTKVKRTFSQSLGEAAFHTDTQYFETPEDYFSLFCIKPDVYGKGTNELLHVDDIVSRILKQHGSGAVEMLARPFPFRVPSVFTETGEDSDVEIVWAPILDTANSTIRYRRDTIDSALDSPGVSIDEEQLGVVGILDSVINEIEPIRYHLESGDAIIVNNLKMLHARTAFENPERFLYRVRMTEDE